MGDANEHSMELIVPFLSFMFLKHHHTNNENGGSIEEHKSSMGSNSTNSLKSTKSSKSSKSSKSADSQLSWTSRFKIVPIMVGSCKPNQHALYGQILSKYFEDESTLFVISSDFCHWGNNYGYVPFDDTKYKSNAIHQYIRDLDGMAMQLIQQLDYHGFYQYLGRTRNTICGQHPICVLLKVVEAVNAQNGKSGGKQWALQFVDYSQSS